MSKIVTMQEAIRELVPDGATCAIEGFTGLICFAAAHEIIRQGKRDLTLCRMTPDLVYDQMIAAGVARKLVFSYLGNPGVGSLYAIRRAVEKSIPRPLEIEEYTHFSMIGRYIAGAARLPFYPVRSHKGSDLPAQNPNVKWITSPYADGEEIAVVPPLNPDVAILHAPRCDKNGNTHLWGLLGMQKEVAFAADTVIMVVEEIVDEAIIRADPNRTLIPDLVVDAIVVEPYGAHPSYVQGYYDRDNAFYLDWGKRSRDLDETNKWLEEWVYSVKNRTEYLEKLGQETLAALQPGDAYAQAINYGAYS
jgi:glutaconate CoA-transferase subunit A